MNPTKALTLSVLVVSFLTVSQVHAQVSIIDANYVRCVRTSGQSPTPDPTNLVASYANKTYFLSINSTGKNNDGMVGINYPKLGDGVFPANANANFVNNFSNFSFFMTQPTMPSSAAYPFTVVVQDASDGFYHSSNGTIAATGDNLFRYRFSSPVGGTWFPALNASADNPQVRKVALVYSGDFVTSVKSVTIPVSLDGPTSDRNPFIDSSNDSNDIPGRHAKLRYATGTADAKFNFDTASN